jgi:hypothetical protein
MTAKKSEQAAAVGVGRIAGSLMIAVGVLGLILALAHQAFIAPIPPVVIYANVSICVVEAGLGIGVLQRKRAAWAFGMAVWGTFIFFNLLALPQMIRAGAHIGGLSALIAAGRLTWGCLLLAARKQF